MTNNVHDRCAHIICSYIFYCTCSAIIEALFEVRSIVAPTWIQCKLSIVYNQPGKPLVTANAVDY